MSKTSPIWLWLEAVLGKSLRQDYCAPYTYGSYVGYGYGMVTLRFCAVWVLTADIGDMQLLSSHVQNRTTTWTLDCECHFAVLFRPYLDITPL
jgi:hypothetical protein